MPHVASGFGEVNINRIYVLEQETAKEDNGDRKLSLEGQESSPPTTLAMCTFLHTQIIALQDGKLVPVTFRDKAQRNGYYMMGSTSSTLTNYQSEAVSADWTIDLNRLGSDTEIDIQSRLTGTNRQNDFAQTGIKWHAPAFGHYGYHTGSTNPSGTIDRVGSEGTVRVYTGVPSGINPKWGCPVGSYKNGRVRINDSTAVTGTESEIEGVNQNISASAWSLGNGLINVTPTASAGTLNVQYYNGSSFVDNVWKIQLAGSNVSAWVSATVLRNDFEMCVLRLMTTQTTAGRTQLDLTLRRGARLVEGYLQSSTSATLKVTPQAPVASTSGTGYVVTTAGTHRPIAGSAHSFTADTGNGGFSKAATLALDFYLGVVLNAASPLTGDQNTDIQNQYIGALPEITYAVKR